MLLAKLLPPSHKNTLVLHVLLVLSANLSWQNGKAFAAKKPFEDALHLTGARGRVRVTTALVLTRLLVPW